jgi:hypothetical protein
MCDTGILRTVRAHPEDDRTVVVVRFNGAEERGLDTRDTETAATAA